MNSNENIWFHGSNNKFESFELYDNKTYQEIDLPVWFFTKDLDYAKTYGKYIYKVKLNINNTFDTSNKEHFNLFIKYLHEDGKTDIEIDNILDEQFSRELPYWTCNDAYYCAVSNDFDSILIAEELETDVESIGIFDEGKIEIVKINEFSNIREIIREELQKIFKDVSNKSIKSKVKLSDLYVESDNILDAYFKAKNNLGPSSNSTGKPLAVTKLLDGSILLLDGHHRIIDRIKYLNTDNVDDILNLKFDAIITTENYKDLDDFPDGEYWIPLFDWIYNMEEQLLNEDINIPINIGDEILTGRFKNKRMIVKTIETNDKGDITINGKPFLRFRIPEKD